MKKVGVDNDRRVKFRGSSEYEGGWYFYMLYDNCEDRDFDDRIAWKCSKRYATYALCLRGLVEDGYEHDNAGWRKKMLSWNFASHSLDNYPGWETTRSKHGHPTPIGFVKLAHRRGSESDESLSLCKTWDDVATVCFYQRDWTSDGIPFVHDNETYCSGWWFETTAERDRFLAWVRENHPQVSVVES